MEIGDVRKKMKGLLRTLEAVLGILVILVTFLFLYTGQGPIPDIEVGNLKLVAMNSLAAIDKNNELRQQALVNDTAAIKAKLEKYIPAGFDYDVFVCNLNCPVPTVAAKRIVSAEYLIAGDVNNFTTRQIVLHVWSND